MVKRIDSCQTIFSTFRLYPYVIAIFGLNQRNFLFIVGSDSCRDGIDQAAENRQLLYGHGGLMPIRKWNKIARHIYITSSEARET